MRHPLHHTRSAICALTVATASATYADSILLSDDYIGGGDHGYGDVIGSSGKFDIHSATIGPSGTELTFTFDSNMESGLGSYAFLTGTRAGGGNEIGYGDLFLSSTGWDPFGSAPYMDDDESTGTSWDYAISLNDRWDSVSTSASFYALDASADNAANTLTSDDFLSSGIYRNGQEVAVNPASASVTWLADLPDLVTTDNGTVVVTVNIGGTALLTSKSVDLHWGITCGNDVIESSFAVPEPVGLAIAIIGLASISFASFRRRRLGLSGLTRIDRLAGRT
jgi:hypothetical protein